MPRFSFETDWVEGDRIQGAELAATWARLAIRVGDTPVTRVFDPRAKTVRDWVFVPLYPLAEWLASNWWFLMEEIESPEKTVDSGFLSRHSLLAAREGYAYPKLSIVRSGTATRLRWQSGQFGGGKLEFLTHGEAQVDTEEVRNAASGFIDQVVHRLVSLGIEGTLLQEEWLAVQSADAEETAFCVVAAGIGWNPYSLDDRERELVLRIADVLSDSVLHEALPILRPEAAEAQADVDAIVAALHSARVDGLSLERLRELSGPVLKHSDVKSGDPPWTLGYVLARELRKQLDLDGQPLRSMAEVGDVLGESAEKVEAATRTTRFDTRRLDGVIASLPGGMTGFALRHGTEVARRFHFVRGLAEFIRSPDSDAILTGAFSERQKIGRAFAAEFLAPSSGLRARVKGPAVDADDVSELAEEFGVSSWVIEHQLDNHGIADVARDPMSVV